jgi:RNA polymerase sigma factor (sigma-70 family)
MNVTPEEFDALVSRYKSMVYAIAYSRVRHYDDARDIAQNVFVSAYLSLHQVQDSASLSSWLRQITVNACNAHFRTRKLPNELDPMQAGEDQIGPLLTKLAVEQALSCLSDQTRLTVTMYYFGSHSLAEISLFLGVPESTVKSRLRDARARLKKEMMHMVEDTLRSAAPNQQFEEDVKRLINAAIRGNLDEAQRLLTLDPSLVGSSGQVAEEHVDFMRSHDADHGWSPLHLAAHYGNLKIVVLLIEFGADIEAVAKNAIANTPISAAAWGNHLDIVEYLAMHGANVDAQNAWGSTALRRAIDVDREPLAELLLKYGADPTVQDKDGKSPITFAEEAGKSRLAALMSSYVGLKP